MKQKGIALLLVAAACLSLTACGKEKEPVTATVPVEVLQPVVESAPDEIQAIEKEWVEMTPDEDSIKFGPEYDGRYDISGYSRTVFNGKENCILYLDGQTTNNDGALDAVAAKIPSFWLQFSDMIYLNLSFKDESHIYHEVYDKMNRKIVSYMSEEEAYAYFFPETTYEEVAAGDLPEVIKLSKYENGFVYVFDVKKGEEEFIPMPKVVNDSAHYQLLAVSFKTDYDEEFDDREYIAGTVFDNSLRGRYLEEGKLYMAVTWVDPVVFGETEECVAVGSYNVGDTVETNFRDFMYNNSDKTLTLELRDSWGDITTAIMHPYEIIGIGNGYNIVVKEIQ